jgi:hypothetical protein
MEPESLPDRYPEPHEFTIHPQSLVFKTHFKNAPPILIQISKL